MEIDHPISPNRCLAKSSQVSFCCLGAATSQLCTHCTLNKARYPNRRLVTCWPIQRSWRCIYKTEIQLMCMCDDMTDVLYMKTHIVVVWTCFLYVMQIAKYLSNPSICIYNIAIKFVCSLTKGRCQSCNSWCNYLSVTQGIPTVPLGLSKGWN